MGTLVTWAAVFSEASSSFVTKPRGWVTCSSFSKKTNKYQCHLPENGPGVTIRNYQHFRNSFLKKISAPESREDRDHGLVGHILAGQQQSVEELVYVRHCALVFYSSLLNSQIDSVT